MSNTTLTSGSHCVYSLNYHLVLVTKYRRRCLTDGLLDQLGKIMTRTCDKWGVDLIEYNGEADHVHLMLGCHPDITLSKLINNLKTVSSRMIRKGHKAHFSQFYWANPGIWTRSYCLISVGGAPLCVLKQYIQNQSRPG